MIKASEYLFNGEENEIDELFEKLSTETKCKPVGFIDDTPGKDTRPTIQQE